MDTHLFLDVMIDTLFCCFQMTAKTIEADMDDGERPHAPGNLSCNFWNVFAFVQHSSSP